MKHLIKKVLATVMYAGLSLVVTAQVRTKTFQAGVPEQAIPKFSVL
jgi:hypothetical protein